MAQVRLGKRPFGANVSDISRLGDPEEVLGRGERLQECIARLELYVMGRSLGDLSREAVIGRGSRVLIGADGVEMRIGAGPEIEEARMWRIGQDGRGICVTFAKLAKSQDADIAQIQREIIA